MHGQAIICAGTSAHRSGSTGIDHQQRESIISASGVAVFDRTVQITNTWLGEIIEHQGPDRQRALHILSAVLHTLRDRLPADLSAHLSAQPPLLMRGTYYDEYEPSKQPAQSRTLDGPLAQVKDELAFTLPVDAKEAVQTLFHVLSHHLDPGEVRKIRESLPRMCGLSGQTRPSVSSPAKREVMHLPCRRESCWGEISGVYILTEEPNVIVRDPG
ncbi:DUF2267 domain-containing protein [Sinorhizobium numidicum]|uniref:DUF2267 domain-containing protein n=1 Tax=Sinorhizobium numidicum TaxID=680248 RepID=A0ABY8D2S4_9HYPH|nr:DUF2267 domain-containing protein [Sinorhizobium numidicum]WEX79165.1 DUF2267 domain-containing protein [Sinorhizobium numidicum]WEX85191.1 DUF2267 domain-containing protein [Sinorhizobium numidicum]